MPSALGDTDKPPVRLCRGLDDGRGGVGRAAEEPFPPRDRGLVHNWEKTEEKKNPLPTSGLRKWVVARSSQFKWVQEFGPGVGVLGGTRGDEGAW